MKTMMVLALLTVGQTDRDQIRTANGSSIYGQVLVSNLEIQTKYGKLIVPWSDVRSVTFGVRPSPGTAERITKAIAGLASSSHKERDQATSDLKSIGELAVPQIRGHITDDSEVRKRLDMIVEDIVRRGGKLDNQTTDLVETDETPIRGAVSATKFSIKSKEIGTIDVARESMVGIYRVRQMSFMVPASGEWIKTDLMAVRGDRLQFKADGQVDLWPQEAGKYLCGPNGYSVNDSNSGYPAGCLVFKVGVDTTFSKVGEESQFQQTHGGTIYFKVIPSPWNTASVGGYRVTVKQDRP